ncbi:MAG TPA: thioredoxin family protein, partial [Chthoniobacterales bacterium]|nr:thioredoxin family protein [Chthoniobacterales bacterium]
IRFTSAQVYEGRQLVRAELVADTTAIVPGKPFTVGLLLHMVPGWHTYWKFPGDAGIPTDLKWTLPDGWKTADIQWPIPLKLNEPGDIQIYGYHDDVLLMQEITPPANMREQNVSLSAEANWLVCEKICIPGSAKLKLDLPVAEQAGPANAELFERFRKQLPQAWPADGLKATWSRDASAIRLIVEGDDLRKFPFVDFFPAPEPSVVVSHPSVENRTDNRVTLRIPVESADKNVTAVDGIFVFGSSDDSPDRRAWAVQVVRPAGSAASIPGSQQQGLLTLFFFGFLGGAILNLMPCVLPVISLKIFGFIQQAGQSRGKIIRSGLAFVAGIFAWFIMLGLLLIALKSAGHQITWAFQFTNPYFVFGMSVLVLVFALNMFGVFEVFLPQAATKGMLSVVAQEGDAGSFFHGMFATLLATPCTAPFLGPALGFAFTQSGTVIMAMFMAIAAGMALPYLLLCAQPAWLRFLPKPGAWMNLVKQLMGFLLLATLLFLLYVIGAQRGLDGLIWTCAFLLVVSLACWIAGVFLVPTASARARGVAVIVIVLLLAGGGTYFVGNKFRNSEVAGPALPTGDWQAFTEEKLQSELRAGNPVFIDFTAAWCLNCKFNEAQVLESDVVKNAFKQRGVTKLKADWTNGDPVVTKYLQQFGRVGVPLYVLYPGNSGEPIVFPELLTKNIVLEKLEGVSRRVASQ